MSRLLTVSGTQIELEQNRTFVFGRAAECDVVVEDPTSSRQHARLYLGALKEVISIEDLGSRNGTYVNEERLEYRTTLTHGSRIRIGATIYLLSLADRVEEDERSMIDTGTVAHESLLIESQIDAEVLRALNSGSWGGDLAGQLGSFGVIEVVQLLHRSGRGGTLHLALECGDAQVEVRKGEILSATFGELDGFQALLVLARLKAGVFWLVETSRPCLKTIEEPTSTLLFELCCRLDDEPAAQR